MWDYIDISIIFFNYEEKYKQTFIDYWLYARGFKHLI